MNATANSNNAFLSVEDLLQHALVIELEAEQSYKELAEQMHSCGNHDVAALFEKMSALEGRHARKIRENAPGLELEERAPWEYRWDGFEPPENAELNEIHYLMKPHHALQLALAAEQRAELFFTRVANQTSSDDVRRLAAEFAADEKQHVVWIREWLEHYPPPAMDWDEDLDPPAAVD